MSAGPEVTANMNVTWRGNIPQIWLLGLGQAYVNKLHMRNDSICHRDCLGPSFLLVLGLA